MMWWKIEIWDTNCCGYSQKLCRDQGQFHGCMWWGVGRSGVSRQEMAQNIPGGRPGEAGTGNILSFIPYQEEV